MGNGRKLLGRPAWGARIYSAYVGASGRGPYHQHGFPCRINHETVDVGVQRLEACRGGALGMSIRRATDEREKARCFRALPRIRENEAGRRDTKPSGERRAGEG